MSYCNIMKYCMTTVGVYTVLALTESTTTTTTSSTNTIIIVVVIIVIVINSSDRNCGAEHR